MSRTPAAVELLDKNFYIAFRANSGASIQPDTGVRPNEPHVNIARAVLIQAAKDAKKDGPLGEEARAFLFEPNEDLDFWRIVAGI